MNANDILPIRRCAVDSRLGQPLGDRDFAGSHFSYRLPWPLTFPKNTKVRVTEASVPHGQVDNVSHARGLHWSEKRYPQPFAGGDPDEEEAFLSTQLDAGFYTHNAFAEHVAGKLNARTTLNGQRRSASTEKWTQTCGSSSRILRTKASATSSHRRGLRSISPSPT